jgi:hypothetical protein
MRRSLGVALTLCPLLFGLAACGGSDSSGATSAARSTAPTTPAGSPTPDTPHYRTVQVGTRTERASRVAAHSYVADSVRLLAAPDSALGRHPTISGPALQSLLAMRREYASKNYHVVGRPEVVQQQVIRHQTHPERLVVAACLDNSGVKVLDSKDEPVATSPGPQRVMNLLTLEQRDGRWVVTRTTLPDDPTC